MQGGDQSPGLDGRRCKDPGSGERNAQRGAVSPGFGARGETLPVRRVAWRAHPNLGVKAIGGALTGSRAGGPDRVRAALRQSALLSLGEGGRGPPGNSGRCVGSDSGRRAKGYPWPLPQGDPHANLRPGDGDSRGRWSGLMMIEPAARSLEAGRKGDAERSCPRCHTHTHTHTQNAPG